MSTMSAIMLSILKQKDEADKNEENESDERRTV